MRIAFAICVLGTAICEAASAGSENLNVLFIAVDDLRPSTGSYGDPHAITPNLDRLAERSVQFNRAYCQVAVCNPSRASLMTGLRPDKLGVWTLPIHFRESRPDAVTIPQWFRRFGYTAVSHGKIFHNPTPDPQSWSEPIRPIGRLESPYPKNTQEWIQEVEASLPDDDWRKNNLRGPSHASPDVEDGELIDGARTELAVEDLRRLGRSNQPFFLAMGYIRPHLPWVAPKKYWEMHDPAELPVIMDGRITPETPPYALSSSYEMTHYADLIDFPRPWDQRRISEQRSRTLMHAYYASVSYVDALIGRLLGVLEEEGLAEQTIVVLWSDHGWKLGEFNGWGKMTNYEIDTRVPLLISVPGPSGAVGQTEELAELVDLYPTLCELAGIPIPNFVDGQSLAPSLKDPETRRQSAAFSQYYRRHEGRQYMGYAMRTDIYRLIEWRDFTSGDVTAVELYDHRVDPQESRNLASTVEPAVLARLTARLLESHPRTPLDLVPAVHSSPSPGRWRSDITFANHSQGRVDVYPITPTGRRGRAARVLPDQKVTFQSRIGGVYVVESYDGRIHEIHSPSFPAKTVVLE